MEHRSILGMRVDRTSYAEATALIMGWARPRESRYVCIATVNNVMESYDSAVVQTAMNQADLVTPDGMPLVWGLRMLGAAGATRVYGPHLMPHVLRSAAARRIPVGFYGGAPDVLPKLLASVRRLAPEIQIAYAFSPPFRRLTQEEDAAIVEAIRQSGAAILFVGMSSPKQDCWMAEHRGRVPAVMLGVGAAFDFIAGVKKQAPKWIMAAGLEWLFRLATEPRRLWRRYLKHNPRFAVLFFAQFVTGRVGLPRRSHANVASRRA